MSRPFVRFVVEGVHDEHVIGHLLLRHNVQFDFDFRPRKEINRNKDFVLQNINELLAPEDDKRVDRFVLILDAETGLANRWNDIRKALHRPLPEAPSPGGTIVAPNLGIWLMPDNQTSGSLEEFFASFIPSGDPLWDYSKKIVPNVPVAPRRFSKTQEGKALVNSWLAWRNPPGLPMGLTLKQSDMPPDSDLATNFLAWIQRLLQTPAE